MKIKVGLDIGGSTTKIVGMQDGKIIAREIVKAADPVTSAFGAVGKLINDHSLSVNDIEQIIVQPDHAAVVLGDQFDHRCRCRFPSGPHIRNQDCCCGRIHGYRSWRSVSVRT